jgi:hypothetical protein
MAVISTMNVVVMATILIGSPAVGKGRCRESQGGGNQYKILHRGFFPVDLYFISSVRVSLLAWS